MLNRVKSIFQSEIAAIQGIEIGQNFNNAIDAIIACKGKIFTTGIGKAGYVARKAASTFSTTGSPAVFLHPGDASHGDVGVVTENDLILAFSNSGKTREVLETVNFSKNLNISKVISVTSKEDSELGRISDIVLFYGEVKEPCPLGFTPTASTTAMLAISDAIALCVMEKRGFTNRDFASRHHGGYLGVKSREAAAK